MLTDIYTQDLTPYLRKSIIDSSDDIFAFGSETLPVRKLYEYHSAYLFLL